MAHLSGTDRSQLLLLPEAIDDYVGPNDPVRFIEAFEHPFGTIKQWMNQGAFLLRRLDNVRGEFSLTALAYNIRRAISLVGVSSLMAAANT